MIQWIRPALAATAALWLLAGCALGPEYRRPEINLPPDPDPDSAQDSGLALEWMRWWQAFDDPQLNLLIERAMANNLELRIGLARLAEARAAAGLARSQQWPTIGAQAEASRERTPTSASPLALGGTTTRNLFSVTGALSWEVDLFGRLAREREAAEALLSQSALALDALRLSLSADIASSYFALRAAQEQLAITEQTLVSRQQTLELEQVRFDAGQIDELALQQARAQLETARAQLPDRQAAVRRQETVLAVLTGYSPTELMGSLDFGSGHLDQITIPAVDLEKLPSNLLERRPDLQAAEAALIAANARIGAAEASRLPNLSLSAFLGSISGETADLFGSTSRAWGAGGQLVSPVVDFGRNRGRVAGAKARAKQAELDWRHTVLNAYQEVRSASIALAAARSRSEAIARLVEVSERTERLAEIRYREGLVSFIELLDAQRTLLEVKLAQSDARRELLAASATFFKALGGGWTEGSH